MTAPLWLTEPCPAWCREQSCPGHLATDHPSDRIHASAIMFTPLLGEPFENFGDPKFEPVRLAADLVQHYLEAEPRVALGDTADAFCRYLSLDETERFAVQLLELVRAGRTGTAVADSPTSGDIAGDRPWCRIPDNEFDEVRHSPEIDTAAGSVGLTYHPDEGARIHLERRGGAVGGSTADEASELGVALLTQAVNARARGRERGDR